MKKLLLNLGAHGGNVPVSAHASNSPGNLNYPWNMNRNSK